MFLMALGQDQLDSDVIPLDTGNQTVLVEDTQKISTNHDTDGASHHQEEAFDLVWTFVSKHLNSLIAGQCHSTYSLQPLYYHIGCAFFLLAFLAPSHRHGAALFMRCMFIFGSVLFAMWSYLSECRPDVLLWSAIFINANLIHLVTLICKLRPVKFDKEIEEVSNAANSKCRAHDISLRLISRIEFTVESVTFPPNEEPFSPPSPLRQCLNAAREICEKEEAIKNEKKLLCYRFCLCGRIQSGKFPR